MAAEECLYRKVMGADFDRLAEPLRAFHSQPSSATGVVSVTRGAGMLAWLVSKFMRLPPESSQVSVELSVCAAEEGEIWQRTFGTTQWQTQQCSSHGHLHETHRAVTSIFTLIERDSALEFRQVGCKVCGVPIGKRFAPNIAAVETPCDGGWSFHVRITFPSGRLITEYGGTMQSA